MEVRYKPASAILFLITVSIYLLSPAVLGREDSQAKTEKKVQAEPDNEVQFSRLREQMVRMQIEARGVKDGRVLQAMRKVKRHLFVPPIYQRLAYEDTPLPIGEEQTISQPYIVALMTELLGLIGSERVLEIGTGSGYQAAILAELAAYVYTIEILPGLAEQAD